jgi:hypothetical protein
MSTFEERISQAKESLQDIPQYESEQQKLLQNPTAVSCTTANLLQDSFDRFEKTIQVLTSFCLSRMKDSGDALELIEIEIESVGGSLEAVRSRAGRELITPPLPVPPMKVIDERFLPRSVKLELSSPDGPYALNLSAYRGVGSRVEDGPTDQPLIRKVAPGQRRALLWSRSNDFFLSDNRYGFSTSFADAYGFAAVGLAMDGDFGRSTKKPE